LVSPFISTSSSLEVAADLLENGLEPLEGVSVKHLSSIFRDEDQMGM
jgi:hypothetical protein